MATRRFECISEQSVADFGGGSERGNGRDLHAPVGLYSGTVFRDLLKFRHDWTGVYQLRSAKLLLQTSNQTHVARGATPRVLVNRLTGAFTQGGGDENSWSVSATTHWGNKPATASAGQADSGSLATSNDRTDSIDILTIMEALAPATVLKSRAHGGGAGGAADNHGLAIRSYDEAAATRTTEWLSKRTGNAWNQPIIEIEYDDNFPPLVASITSPIPSGSDAAIVASTSGQTLDVTYVFNGYDSDDRHGKVRLQVVAYAATDAVPGDPIADTGPIAVRPLSNGTYVVSIAGLPRPHIDALWSESGFRFRIQTADDRTPAVWGPWTPLDANSLIYTAFRVGKPRQPVMTTNRVDPHIQGTINSLDPDDEISAVRIVATKVNVDSTRETLVDTGKLGVGASTTRHNVAWSDIGGPALADGQVVTWQHWHWNRDDVEGEQSEEYQTTVRTVVGPTVTPADISTKLNSRTNDITLTFESASDIYQYNLYRNGELIHASGEVTIASAASVTFALPSGKVGWGDTLEIEAASHATGDPVTLWGSFSPRSGLYINALPTTTLLASIGDEIPRDILTTRDVYWTAPFIDPDATSYIETPTGKEIEFRVADTPPGTGGLMERRMSSTRIPYLHERTGETLADLDATTGVTVSAGVLATQATNPAGYSDQSLRWTVTSLAFGAAASLYLPLTDDQMANLAEYGGGAPFYLWTRSTNRTGMTLQLVLTGATWALTYDIEPTSDSTYYGVRAPLGDPVGTSGTPWSSPITSVSIYVHNGDASAQTYDMHFRDLRIGTVTLAWEATYDVRARYRDNATVKVTGTTAASVAASDAVVKYNAPTGTWEVGDELTLDTADGTAETRRITGVGTVGAGGTGLFVDVAYTLGHANGATMRGYPWGTWSSWATVKLSEAPVTAAAGPADQVLLADPTPDLVHTYGSIKAQALRTIRLYRRLGYADFVETANPSDWWRLGETSGTTATSLHGNYGTYTGGAGVGYTLDHTSTLTPADTNGSLFLNGSAGYVTIPTSVGMHPGDTFSIRARLAKAFDGVAMTIMAAGTGDYQLRINASNQLELLAEGNATPIMTSALTITGTDVHQVAVTKGGSTTKLYIDGVEDTGATGSNTTIVASAIDVTIGRKASSAAEYWAGTLDEVQLYSRVVAAGEEAASWSASLEVPGDVLIREWDETGTGLTDTMDALILENSVVYAWEKTVYDTEGLEATTERLSFLTVFTTPSAVAGLAATADTDDSSVALTWTASADTYLDHYRVYWQAASGSWQRVDGGPEEAGDDNAKLTTAGLTHYGARLGVNTYRVTVHNGAQESEVATVAVTLDGPESGGSWLIVDEDDGGRYTRPLRVLGAPRTHRAVTERFDPPGRGEAVHLKWGSAGKSWSLDLRLRPTTDGDLSTILDELQASLYPVWLKAPAGWLFDPAWVTVTGLVDRPGMGGMLDITVDFETTERLT